MRYLLAFLLAATSANAATYYVSIGGNDTTGTGAQGNPWRTIQKGANTATTGDTVYISTGDYWEYVNTVANGVTFAANPTNVQWSATTYEIRLKHQNTTVSGLVFQKGASANDAAIRIEPPGAVNNGSGAIITNCYIKDTPLLLSRTASFGSNWVHVADAYEGVDFKTAGFTNGAPVFFGADSLYAFTNHGTAHTVASNSADGLTMFVTDTLSADPGSNYWILVAPGGDNQTYSGIQMPVGSSVAASNCFIVNNVLSNLMGRAMVIDGNSNRVFGNKIFKNHGGYAMQIFGSNTEVATNLIYNSPNVEYFTPDEINGAQHPAGGSYYDWQCNVTASFGSTTTNIDFHHNWIQDCANQLTQIGDQIAAAENAYGYKIRYCVFIGLYTGSFSRHQLMFDHCTFYRNAFDIAETTVLGIGGTGGVIQTNLQLTSCLFVDNGEHANPPNEYPYGLSSMTNYIVTNNYSVTAETMGFGITGTTIGILTNQTGDPGFLNPKNPLGPDGLPFTADDGLRPLPNTYVGINGLGALSTMPSTNPVAHFKVKLASPGWKDATGTNYNPAWAALRPDQRGGNIRPYNTPEALGAIPVTATFDASGSIDGTGTNNVLIKAYAWDFGDGQKCTTILPAVSHTYMQTGQVTVLLTITNLYNATSVYSNLYRLLPQTNSAHLYWVATNGNNSTGDGSIANPWLTLTKASAMAVPGDYVGVTAGTYLENVDLTVAGTASSPIRFVGYGATVGSWNCRKSHIAIEGFSVNFTNAAGGAFYIYPTVTNLTLANNFIGPSASADFLGVYCAIGVDGLPDNSQQSCTVSNNELYGISSQQIGMFGRGHKIIGNAMHDTDSGQCDLFRVLGADHLIARNSAWNICKVSENHTDFYQIFGPDTGTFYIVATNIVIDGNVVKESNMAICQIENFLNPSGYFTNITIRNNVFSHITGQANIDAPGFKFYNNLFYQITNPPGVAVFGGTKGDAYGSEFQNNAFVMCSYGSPSVGWYGRMEDVGITNYDLIADYNFVCGTNFLAKQVVPPNDSSHWGATGGTPSRTWEAHGVNGGDPLFLDAANGDFRPATNSPLIGKGVTIAGFNTDAYGNTRPSSWAIGPFEAANSSGGSGPTPPVVSFGTARITTLRSGHSEIRR